MGTGVAMVAGGVDTVVGIADCGGAGCEELVHPAQKISTRVIPRIPKIWTGFIGRRLLSAVKMVWLYCKMCTMRGLVISALLLFENPTDTVIFPVRSELQDIFFVLSRVSALAIIRECRWPHQSPALYPLRSPDTTPATAAMSFPDGADHPIFSPPGFKPGPADRCHPLSPGKPADRSSLSGAALRQFPQTSVPPLFSLFQDSR